MVCVVCVLLYYCMVMTHGYCRPVQNLRGERSRSPLHTETDRTVLFNSDFINSTASKTSALRCRSSGMSASNKITRELNGYISFLILGALKLSNGD